MSHPQYDRIVTLGAQISDLKRQIAATGLGRQLAEADAELTRLLGGAAPTASTSTGGAISHRTRKPSGGGAQTDAILAFLAEKPGAPLSEVAMRVVGSDTGVGRKRVRALLRYLELRVQKIERYKEGWRIGAGGARHVRPASSQRAPSLFDAPLPGPIWQGAMKALAAARHPMKVREIHAAMVADGWPLPNDNRGRAAVRTAMWRKGGVFKALEGGAYTLTDGRGAQAG